MDSKELLNLIRFVAKAGVSEVKYKTKDFEINIKTPLGGSEPAISFAPQPVAYQAPIAAPVAAATRCRCSRKLLQVQLQTKVNM